MQNYPSLSSTDEKLNEQFVSLTGFQLKIAAEALGAAFSRDPFMSYLRYFTILCMGCEASQNL